MVFWLVWGFGDLEGALRHVCRWMVCLWRVVKLWVLGW